MMVNFCEVETLQRLCMHFSLYNEDKPRHDTFTTNFHALSGNLVMTNYVKVLVCATRSTFEVEDLYLRL